MNIFIGNLPFSATEAELRPLFEAYGTVQSLKLITDRETGRPRGFGFIEMGDADADAAIKGLNGTDLKGRPMKVNQAEAKKSGSGSRRF